MTRLLLTLAIVALRFAVPHEAWPLPPDEVAHSPIPPLQEPVRRQTSRTAPQELDAQQQIQQRSQLSNPSANTSPQRENAPARQAVAEDKSSYSSEEQDPWNSPQMREARKFVQEFARRSAQTSPAEGERFLKELSQLPPDQMQRWLQRFRTRNEQIERGRALDEFRRQWSVENARSRFEQNRRAAARNAKLRDEAAESRHMVLRPKPGWSWQLESKGNIFPVPIYNPWDPVFDPMSPRGFVRRAAAAVSLPGDLPPSDPRNYITGEEGINFGEDANGSNPPPPSAPPADAPSPPASGSEAAAQ